MAGFDRAHKGFFDLATLRRALSNAFGNQWVELAMTTAEFQQICDPYLTRKPADAGIAGAPDMRARLLPRHCYVTATTHV